MTVDKESATALSQAVSRVLYSEEQIQSRVLELGSTISADYAGRNPLLVGVLKGVFIFMSDLLRASCVAPPKLSSLHGPREVE